MFKAFKVLHWLLLCSATLNNNNLKSIVNISLMNRPAKSSGTNLNCIEAKLHPSSASYFWENDSENNRRWLIICVIDYTGHHQVPTSNRRLTSGAMKWANRQPSKLG